MQYDCKYFIISIIISTTESVERSYKGGNHEKKDNQFRKHIIYCAVGGGNYPDCRLQLNGRPGRGNRIEKKSGI